MKQPVERRLAAILAADVAAYSRLMGADEEGTHERLKAHRGELIEPKITEHRGRIVKTTGDGMLVEFPSVVDAVRCAAEIQRAMLDRNAQTSEDKRITFRIGINLGDVIIDGDDIYGDGVNIAARLEALAEPGAICISRVVRDQIRDKLPYPFEDMGEQSVKNIARPVRAYAMSAHAVALTPQLPATASLGRARSLQRAIILASAIAVLCAALVAWLAWPNGTSRAPYSQAPATASSQKRTAAENSLAPRLSIVVLPFANLSGDSDQEYFADGITDDLTTDLSRIPDSFVIARTTAFTYKGKQIDVKQVGRELGVRYALEGSVRRLGDTVQVNVQLIDTENGAHIWADRFDADRSSLAEAQSEITGRLARTLDVTLSADVARRIEQQHSADPDAREFVMRGRAIWNRPRSPTRSQEALQTFERALEIDPSSVDARIGIARVLAVDASDGFSNSIERDTARAEALLLEAIERDPNRSMAHALMVFVRRLQNRFAEAKSEAEQAVALDRNNLLAIRLLGQTLVLMGEPEAAFPYIERGLRLSPREGAAVAYSFLGLCQLVSGHTDEAVSLLRKARAENLRVFWIRLTLAGALGLQDELAETRSEIAEALKLKPEISSIGKWRAYLATTGHGFPKWQALMDKTVYAGLRRAGFPDE
jgi:adenylate cyclase